MSEQNEQPQAEQPAQPTFQLLRCYLKDASLEMPHAPEIFMQNVEEQPGVDIKFEVSTRNLPAADVCEVVVRGTITVAVKETVMFLVEGKQAGIFEISGLPEDGLKHVQNVVCPQIIYPYLRANLADLITRTGLPPVHLPEVNFELLYQQRAMQQEQGGNA
ncbi:MAG: protein-export chaperone SecB [Duodenibacillus sp.]|nr:protein-export chaperone SecB [Duodenibacillus sp.]